MSRSGIPFVVAAPSGTGKTTVCRRVVGGDPRVEFSVSHTTRARREGEREGVDYHFVDEAGFRRLIGEGAFLEWAEYNHHLYGTSWRAIDEPLGRGRDVVLEIEVQGAAQVRERRSDARFVFLLPPSMKVLEQRLRTRGTDDEAGIASRLARAEEELRCGEEFDYAVVNDDLDRCVAEVAAILAAERAGDARALRERLAPGPAIARLRAGGAVGGASEHR